MILPNFPKNYMKLKEFEPPTGGARPLRSANAHTHTIVPELKHNNDKYGNTCIAIVDNLRKTGRCLFARHRGVLIIQNNPNEYYKNI